MIISIIIRTLNEERYLAELLGQIQRQVVSDEITVETVVIDSGSTDRTLEIADGFQCRVTYIDKKDFSFGRSLNRGSEFSQGEVLVYISGHCVPQNDYWLEELTKPLQQGVVQYSYGRQIGRDWTKYSEQRFFDKFFPTESRLPQKGYWCNNANSAILRKTWDKYRFDERITGLEDLELAKRLVDDGGKVGYVCEASVFHIHHENWIQTKNRYLREAFAMGRIEQNVSMRFSHMLKYILISVRSDLRAAFQEKRLREVFFSVLKFRTAQYLGSYLGSRKVFYSSMRDLERFYYP